MECDGLAASGLHGAQERSGAAQGLQAAYWTTQKVRVGNSMGRETAQLLSSHIDVREVTGKAVETSTSASPSIMLGEDLTSPLWSDIAGSEHLNANPPGAYVVSRNERQREQLV